MQQTGMRKGISVRNNRLYGSAIMKLTAIGSLVVMMWGTLGKQAHELRISIDMDIGHAPAITLKIIVLAHLGIIDQCLFLTHLSKNPWSTPFSKKGNSISISTGARGFVKSTQFFSVAGALPEREFLLS